MPWGGHPQGAPLLPSLALCPEEGTHKGRPYQLSSLGDALPLPLSSLGVMPWGGHPQGAPLPIVFSRRGRPQGAPLPIVFSRRYALPIVFFRRYALEGTHKGRPYPTRRYALRRAPTGSLTWFCPNLMQLPWANR